MDVERKTGGMAKDASGSGTPDFRNIYRYDKLNRLTEVIQTNQVGGNQVLPKRVTMAYNALDQRTQIARFQSTGTANPVATTNFTYDTANRLSGIAHKQGATNLNTHWAIGVSSPQRD